MTARARVVALTASVAVTLVATAVPVATTAAPATRSGVARVASTATSAATTTDAVVARRKLGESVRGRPIWAFRLGERGAEKVVLISTMHGDERATRQILWSLKDRRPIKGVDLWVVPTYNPDGVARGTRKNARGVDLNRNFPHRWTDLDGSYESGPRPRSEPETRAMIRFLNRVEPHRILSFHQPLHGVDQDTKNKRFARRVARTLGLPKKVFDCGGVCHGTMTSWFNHRHDGAALTVEYGSSPSRRMMRHTAPRRVLDLFDARRVRVPR